jgi:phage tail-like protein
VNASLRRVPPVPAPPHDPSSLLLGGHVSWRFLVAPANVEVDLHTGALQLAPLAASLPPFANAAGTFGNLTLPSNVTITESGIVLLLDVTRAVLRKFDRCACRFEDVPHIGGFGAPVRHWNDPHAIAARDAYLYVCDTGHERVAVYTLNGLAFNGDLRPPAAGFPHWEPYAIAFDSKGRAFVTDRSNGVVHRFSRRGIWQRAIPGFSQPTAIAVDCTDRIFVVQQGAMGPEVRVITEDGSPVDVPPRQDQLSSAFPELPLQADASGRLRLGPLCGDSDPSCCAEAPQVDWFDANGDPAPSPTTPATPIYTGTGQVICGPLDSKTSRCVWHRIVVSGLVPDQTKVLVETFTADEFFDADQVLTLATWDTGRTARQVDGNWDCLVRGAAGRFVWIRLTLTSMGGPTPRIDRLIVEFPRVSLRRFLPAMFGAEPVSADFTDRFLALFDTTLRSVERQIDTEAALFDPLSSPSTRVDGAPIDFLTWLGTWVGLTIDRRLNERTRRRMLKQAGRLLDRRGTLGGLRDQIALLIGLDRFQRCCPPEPARRRCCPPPLNCAPDPPPQRREEPPIILEHFRLRRWLWVGQGRLGSEAVLWGNRIAHRSPLNAGAEVGRSELVAIDDPLRDPYLAFAHKFTAFVPCRYRRLESERRALEQLLRTESPAHTQHQIVFVEPRFRIGVQSMIGFDAVIGRVPEGVRLDQAPLGRATVLTAKTARRPFALGEGRIGTTDYL